MPRPAGPPPGLMGQSGPPSFGGAPQAAPQQQQYGQPPAMRQPSGPPQFGAPPQRPPMTPNSAIPGPPGFGEPSHVTCTAAVVLHRLHSGRQHEMRLVFCNKVRRALPRALDQSPCVVDCGHMLVQGLYCLSHTAASMSSAMLADIICRWSRILCWPAGDPAASMQHPSYSTMAPPGYDATATSVSFS